LAKRNNRMVVVAVLFILVFVLGAVDQTQAIIPTAANPDPDYSLYEDNWELLDCPARVRITNDLRGLDENRQRGSICLPSWPEYSYENMLDLGFTGDLYQVYQVSTHTWIDVTWDTLNEETQAFFNGAPVVDGEVVYGEVKSTPTPTIIYGASPTPIPGMQQVAGVTDFGGDVDLGFVAVPLVVLVGGGVAFLLFRKKWGRR